ncbi:Alcohol dehydrogenase [NADP(+)] A [Melipona quadrifasciata]|uniref:Alcohol dehydrogenase [NADP(+)] A n=1 Tax=Melipona quadrifasciata TaxID=166423 RepID=A0A0N0BDU3_9HYME|nr:Alcohol dehydrogenase [NADP(+)] A [Melipona quadrifasciata]
MENSYKPPDETGKPTRLVLETGHKRRMILNLKKHLLSKGLPSNKSTSSLLNALMMKFYNSGNEVPSFGLGTWKSKPGEVTQAVKDAVDIGYSNEKEVGAVLKAQIYRGCCKKAGLWNTFHRLDLVKLIIKTTLSNLGLDLFPQNADDTPALSNANYADTWEAMEALVSKGKILMLAISILNKQTDCLKAALLNHSLAKLAKKYNKTPVQVLIRYQLDHGYIVIPKLVAKSRIA